VGPESVLGSTVTVQLNETVPVMGLRSPASSSVADTLGAPTLSRFYSATSSLPATLIGLLFVHFWMVRKQASPDRCRGGAT